MSSDRGAPPSTAPARAPGSTARVGQRPALDLLSEGEEHREFPRARMALRFELWIESEGELSFSASLSSVNISVSGAFLESTFFLPVGTELSTRFYLEEGSAPVEALAEIVREERDEDGASGFGVRFTRFFAQTEVALAKLFLGHQLRTFSEEYLRSARARSLGSELDRVVDALAAWELLKVTTPGDPWRPES